MAATAADSTSSLAVPPALYYPTIMMENLPNSDPLSTLISKHLPHPRPLRDLSGHLNVPNLQSFDPYESIQQGHWRKVATFSRLSILSLGNSNQPVSALATMLEYWSLRLIALVRLRLHGIVEDEINKLWEVLGNSQVEGQSLLETPMIPFALHVIRARSPRNFNSDVNESISRLWEVLRGCKTRERECRSKEKRLMKRSEKVEGETSNAEVEIRELGETGKLWKDRKDRCRFLIAGYMAEMKDYPSAVALLEPLLPSSDPQLLSLISRLHLQAGSLSTSSHLISLSTSKAQEKIPQLENCLKSAASEQEALNFRTEILGLKNLMVTDHALLLVATGKFDEARRVLKEFRGENREIVNENGDQTSLLNNLAIATFYGGRLEEPLEILEGLLKESPSQVTSTESLIFNLTTFHELRREDSVTDKIRILTLVAQWSGEGNSSSCLKLA